MNPKHNRPAFLCENDLNINYNKINKEIGQANYALGLLEGSQKKLQNPSLLISPLSAKEATVSSKIEGTISTVSDVFLYEAGGKAKDLDTKQVINYRKTMNFALDEFQRGRKISTNFLESMQAILLDGIKPKANLGKYREDTVYIGKKGDSIEKAAYIPPEFYLVKDYMEDLINYLSKNEEDPLIKAGLFHYQFEAVHPFNDGNGRIGRLMIPLILFNEKKLSSPILYCSGYFEKNRDEYIGALRKVDQTKNYEHWLDFFLRGVSEQLQETQEIIDKIYNLYDEIKIRFKITKSPYLFPFVDFIFEAPYFTIPLVQQRLKGVSILTARRLVKLFQKVGIIQKLDFRVGHSILYKFSKLLDILG